ncbi:hypothetical protein CHS0354_008508 [Potamilus streckersoni]|uniref:Uncharacterized protein n=1 Tax=Potamilus streckersoni TaxID=2493646 RepID=A0AAE0S7N6_9BIVA|nr:hypothetical protein CHS0354_008508 [Potamilus streckersoni]
MRSCEWPNNHRELGKIFACRYWEEGKLNDVPTYLAIFENCNDFELSDTVLDQMQKIRDARNIYIGHNASLELSDSDKTRIFAMLKQFVSATEIVQAINVSSLKKTFHNIEKGIIFQSSQEVANRIQKIEEQIQKAKSQEDTNTCLQLILKNVVELENDIREATINLIIPNRRNSTNIPSDRKFRRSSKYIWVCTLLILLPAFLFPWTRKDAMRGK